MAQEVRVLQSVLSMDHSFSAVVAVVLLSAHGVQDRVAQAAAAVADKHADRPASQIQTA